MLTDESPCVCVTIRKPLIWLNDFLKNDERQELIPYLERAMGSATDDKEEISRRLKLLVKFAQKQSGIAATYAATTYAPTYACAAATAAHAACVSAADAAATNRRAAYVEIKAAAFEYFDAALPKSSHASDVLIERAKSLVAAVIAA